MRLTLLALLVVGASAHAAPSAHPARPHPHSGDSSFALAAELAHLRRTSQQRGDDAALIIDTLVNGDFKGLTWDRLANFTDTSQRTHTGTAQRTTRGAGCTVSPACSETE